MTEPSSQRPPSWLGCLTLPLLLAVLSLSAGIWLLQGWSASAPITKLLAVLLTIAGGIALLAATLLLLAAVLLARFVKGLKRDLGHLGYSLRYMARMGRMENPNNSSVVDVVAQHPSAPPDESPKSLPQRDDPPDSSAPPPSP